MGSLKERCQSRGWGTIHLHSLVVFPTPRGMSLNKKFPRLLPNSIRKGMTVVQLVDDSFKAYNGGRLAEACRLFTQKMVAGNGTVGMSLTGALTPAGLGKAAIVPLMKAGFVDWIISTGANLYHDLHYGLGMELYAGSPFLDDVVLRKEGVIRIYDVLFDYDVLLDTDAFVREVIQGPEFQRTMGTDEFHYLLGKYVAAREKKLGLSETSVLAAAYKYGVPIFTSSPGATRFKAADGREPRCEPDRSYRVRREVERGAEQRVHPGRWIAEEFHAANGAANPRGDGHRGARARLLSAMHRRPPRHRRTERCNACGGGELGENRSG